MKKLDPTVGCLVLVFTLFVVSLLVRLLAWLMGDPNPLPWV